MELISTIQHYVRASKEGVTRATRDLIPHTQAEMLWDCHLPVAPAPTAAYVPPAMSQLISLTAQQVAMLQAQFPPPPYFATLRPPVTSKPHGDLNITLPSTSFLDKLQFSQPFTPAPAPATPSQPGELHMYLYLVYLVYIWSFISFGA